MEAQTLRGGFSNPAIQSANAFRAVMEAMARPGTIQPIAGAMPPPEISPAAGAVLLCLCDADTPLYLAGGADCRAVRDWVAFHTGAPITNPANATFALGPWEALAAISDFLIGTSEYPDRSTTLIVEIEALSSTGATLRGPGILNHATLSLPQTERFCDNHKLFPLGLDFIFTSGSRLAALPRSTEVS